VASSLELHPGDSLLLCAGGTSRGGLVGYPRFAAVPAGGAGSSAEDVLERVGATLADRGTATADGTSFLALRVRGGRGRPPEPREAAP
jgi:hypothetical protein